MYAQSHVVSTARKQSVLRTLRNPIRQGRSPHQFHPTIVTPTARSHSVVVDSPSFLFSCCTKIEDTKKIFLSPTHTCSSPIYFFTHALIDKIHPSRRMQPCWMVTRKFSSKEEEDEEEISPRHLEYNAAIWEKNIQALKNFQLQFGHLKVPKVYSTHLHGFVHKQRAHYRKVLEGKKASLTPERIKQLNDIGFTWCPLDDKWDEKYNQLKQLYEKEGTSHFMLVKIAPPELVKWASHQRHLYNRLLMNKPSALSKERLDKLNAIGFPWNVNDSDWMEMFEELRSMLQNDNFSTFEVAQTKGRLRTWIKNQRREFKAYLEGKRSYLTTDKVEKLLSINFAPENPNWQNNFDSWLECKAKHGNSSAKYPKKIAHWVSVQRREYINRQEGRPSALNEKKLNLLLQAGFEFDVKFSIWKKRFEEWKDFRDRLLIWKEQQAKGEQTTSRPKETELLNGWIYRQAQLFLSHEERKSLPSSSSLKKIKLLQSERFFEESLRTYSPLRAKRNLLKAKLTQTERKESITGHGSAAPFPKNFSPEWLGKLLALHKYKEKYGDCCISPTNAQYMPLRLWVEEQCLNFANGNLSKDQVDELQELGLNFQAVLEDWNDMQRQMTSFYLKYGHCVIPSNDVSLKPLFDWAQRQRVIRHLLSAAQYDSLCNCGFSWDEKEAVWKEMIFALRSFRSEHGHCAVPQVYAPHPSLAVWVMQMRQEYKRFTKGESTTLSESQLEELEKEGFIWDECSWQWELRYKELLDFSLANGHCSVPLWYPPNPQLGHWVVIQQRQLDMMRRGLPHKLTPKSVELLENIGL
jgi:hypothetical protein